MNTWLFRKLKRRYPDIRQGPDPCCLRCHGAGERYFAYALGNGVVDGWKPCLCLYTNHEQLLAASRLNAWKRAGV